MDSFWKRIKPSVTKLVMWSVKKHWVFLVVLMGMQFVTGKQLTDEWVFFNFERGLVFRVHSFLGFLLLLAAIGLAIEKLYLWLLRKGRL